jgi:transposase
MTCKSIALELAKGYPFAALLNSQARQTSADRAWLSIARFYKNCREKKPGKKGYPRFQHDNRSVEYKTTGWVRHVCSKPAMLGDEQQFWQQD